VEQFFDIDDGAKPPHNELGRSKKNHVTMAANFWKINRRQPEAISDNTCASFHSWRWVFTEIKTPYPELNSATLAEFS
jgi:hypothetical protein